MMDAGRMKVRLDLAFFGVDGGAQQRLSAVGLKCELWQERHCGADNLEVTSACVLELLQRGGARRSRRGRWQPTLLDVPVGGSSNCAYSAVQNHKAVRISPIRIPKLDTRVLIFS